MQPSETIRESLVLTAVGDMLTILSDLEARDEIGKDESDSARRLATKATLGATADDQRAFWLSYASLVVRSNRHPSNKPAPAKIPFLAPAAVLMRVRAALPLLAPMARRAAVAALTVLVLVAIVSTVNRAGGFRQPLGVLTADMAAPPETALVDAADLGRTATPTFVPVPATVQGYGTDHPNFAGLAPPRPRAHYDLPQMGM